MSRPATRRSSRGGDAETNAAALRNVLEGETQAGGRRDAVAPERRRRDRRRRATPPTSARASGSRAPRSTRAPPEPPRRADRLLPGGLVSAPRRRASVSGTPPAARSGPCRGSAAVSVSRGALGSPGSGRSRSSSDGRPRPATFGPTATSQRGGAAATNGPARAAMSVLVDERFAGSWDDLRRRPRRRPRCRCSRKGFFVDRRRNCDARPRPAPTPCC